MTSLLQLLPHQPGLAGLQSAAAGGQLARCLVFAGPEGSGRRSSALALAKWLHCKASPPPISFCGQCRSCRLIDEDLHADVIWLRPPLFTRKDHPWLVWESHGKADKARSDSLQVSIVQARNLRADAATPPAEGPCKVYLLQGADAMQLEANDALLKTLEEPPSYAYFCLIAQSPSAIRPTILSRAQVIRFLPLPESLVAGIVSEQVPAAAARAAEIASYAGGSPGLALQLAGDPALLDLADQARQMLADCLTGDELAALKHAPRLHAIAAQWFALRYQPPSPEADEPEEPQSDEEEVPEEPKARRLKIPATGVRLGAIQLVDLLANVLRAALRTGAPEGTISTVPARGSPVAGAALGVLSEGRAALEANANLASCLSTMLLGIAALRPERAA